MTRTTLADSLADCLDLLGVSELKGLADVLGLLRLPQRRAELLDRVRGAFTDGALRGLWERLPTVERAAVSEVVHSAEGTLSARAFLAKYGEVAAWGTLNARGSNRPSALHAFFPIRQAMPDELKERLRAFVPAPQPAKLAALLETVPARLPETNEPVHIVETEVVALRELPAVLRLVDAGKVEVTDSTRRATATALRALGSVLAAPDFCGPTDPVRAFAWPLLLQAAGLTRLRGQRLELSPRGRDALGKRPEVVLTELWRSWADGVVFDELRRIDEVKGQEGRGKKHFTPLPHRRDSIAAVLADCPVGRWVELKAFLKHMRAMRREVAVSTNPWHLYVTDAHHGNMGYSGCAPVLTEAYVRCVLLEYLATLGLIDVASVAPEVAPTPYWTSLWGVDELERFSRYDGLLYLRLTPLGAYAFGLAERYEAPVRKADSDLRVLPNLDVVATNGLAAADRITLDLYAVQSSEYVWRLERERLLQAAEEGRPVAEIRTFLEAASGGTLPDTVARFLAETEQRATSLSDAGEARLFECADAALALLVASDSRARGACMLAGERHLVVPASSEKRFRGALRKLGYGVSPAGGVVREVRS